ncbi:EP300-interacting inhibitor of differentiation 3 [Tenrec ecaudatus]|uniref:EP300-interacting inhibitor of differentiation 3 n=1 Tax=Tenrec ecaudatus TaxID=94439 RepID=UPI003F5ABFF8
MPALALALALASSSSSSRLMADMPGGKCTLRRGREKRKKRVLRIPLNLQVDEEKCRHIRKQYRRLMHTVQEQREDIVNTASELLTEALQEADALFDGVSRTREAALDAQFLVLASDVGKEKAHQLNADMCFFNLAAFRGLLFVFAGLSGLEETRSDLGQCEDRLARAFWEQVHRKATPWMLQAETFHFVFGSFSAEPSARKPRQRKRVQRLDQVHRDMPTKLRAVDLGNDQVTTEKEVERILGLLQTYFRQYPDTPVPYFEFVVDPNSFSRTVENIFYVSFIIRDGFARIRLDQDRLPILEPINMNQMEEEHDPGYHGRKQGVISLSLQDWKNIVATFEISEAMITSS